MEAPDKCPVCLDGGPDRPRHRYEQLSSVKPSNGKFIVDCQVCGNFSITEELWEDYLDPNSEEGRKLSEVSRARLSHRIATGSATGSSKRIALTDDFLLRFVEAGCPGPTPSEQATNIIRFIGDSLSSSGQLLQGFPINFHAIVGSPSPVFCDELVAELIARNLLTGIASESMGGRLFANMGLTLDGWQKFEAERRGLVEAHHGFIAMKFNDPELDPFVDTVVKPAVKKGIGYNLFDMRDIARAGIIDNIMRAQIRDAAFVVVDLTHDNLGAYWEAGYAEGLGKQVIYICNKTKFDKAKTHFDTNHCTTVLWSIESADDFCRELIATIRRSINLFPSA